VTLLYTDNKRLYLANKELSRHRKAPRIELKRREVYTTKESTQIIASKNLVAQININSRSKGGNSDQDGPTQSRYSIYQEPGHNKRTCPNRSIDPALVNRI
jgi:hypothetical protein